MRIKRTRRKERKERKGGRRGEEGKGDLDSETSLDEVGAVEVVLAVGAHDALLEALLAALGPEAVLINVSVCHVEELLEVVEPKDGEEKEKGGGEGEEGEEELEGYRERGEGDETEKDRDADQEKEKEMKEIEKEMKG